MKMCFPSNVNQINIPLKPAVYAVSSSALHTGRCFKQARYVYTFTKNAARKQNVFVNEKQKSIK